MAGLRVLWPDKKPNDEVLKTIDDLRQKGNYTAEELEKSQTIPVVGGVQSRAHGRRNSASRK